MRGVEVDWGRAFQGSGAVKTRLPSYAFQRRHYWLGADGAGAGDVSAAGVAEVEHALLGAAVGLAGGEGAVFTGRLSLDSHPWLADHAVRGAVLLPGTAFVELAICAGAQVGCETLTELVIEAPLALAAGESVQLQVRVAEPDDSGRRAVSVYSREQDSAEGLSWDVGSWRRHADGVLAAEGAAAERLPSAETVELAGEWPPRGAERIEIDGLYEALGAFGLEHGPAFQGLRAVWRRGHEVFAEARLSEDQWAQAERFLLHPALFDAALHCIAVSSLAGAEGIAEGGVLLPFAWSGVRLVASGASSLRLRLVAGEKGVSLAMADERGELVGSVDSLVLRAVSGEQIGATGQTARRWLFGVDWVSVAAGPDASFSWALIGGEGATPERGPGSPVHEDLAVLGGVEDVAAAAPAVVLVDCAADGSADELVGTVRAMTHRALGLIQAWLAEERLSASRLVFLTRGAVDGGSDVGGGARDLGDHSGLAQAAVWGLVRSAQTEAPGRFVLVDLDGEETSWAALRGALESDETQLAIRRGSVMAPRLARIAAKAVTNGCDGERLDPQRTVLITGGTSGLGALVARHLVAEWGARSVVLASRRGGETPAVRELVAELEELGALVSVRACDVSDREQVRELLTSIPHEHPLGMVVHAAAVLDDGMIGSLTGERVDRVLSPKVAGAWHLHELTEQMGLRELVLFSSAAGVLGTPGQSSYAAGNAFLDRLAEHRRALGLPGVSMAWGEWAQRTELTGRLRELDRSRMARMGSVALSDEEGLELFDAACAGDRALAVPAGLDLRGLGRGLAGMGTVPPLLRGLVRLPPRSAARNTRGSLARRVVAALPQEREEIVLGWVRSEAAAVLGHTTSDAVPVQRPFLELGFDSLLAVELRNRLSLASDLQLPATTVFDHPSTVALADYLYRRLGGGGEVGAEDRVGVGVGESTAGEGNGVVHAGVDVPAAAVEKASGTAGERPPGALAALMRQAFDVGKLGELGELLRIASGFRATFDGAGGNPPTVSKPVRLARGAGRQSLICVPSITPIGGPHQYVKFARELRGERDVSALSLPGFRAEEPLPATMEAAVNAHLQSIRALAAEAPFVLVGHSTGGALAHAIAEHLESVGPPPGGVVLLDSYSMHDGALGEIMGAAMAGILARDGAFVSIDDARLTAMAAYMRLLSDWEPVELAAPTLLVRASEPMPDAPDDDGWRASWSSAHGTVEVPGDHFTIIEEHAAATARAVGEWLSATDLAGSAP
ncbi:MAG TPA: type I polyketide synthase [Solirubrobacteraceae bacterium]|nr:type I polyketide synthase [Solirubrobacteraceae bacterium]